MSIFKIYVMKTIKRIYLMSFIVAAIFVVSCKKTYDIQENNNQSLASSVTGSYTGELKNSQTNQTVPASLTVSVQNDSMVAMHCVADQFDTTITMLLYQNYDSLMVCYTGQDFYDQYGHNLNNNNFCNSKAAGWDDGWCMGNNCWGGEDQWNAWTNHLNTQHDSNDRHFGGFDVQGNACKYDFESSAGNTTYFESFTGFKKQK